MSALNRRAFVRQMAGGVVATSLLAAIAGCGRKQAARAQLVPAGSTVLALGDSLTYGTGASPETAYPTVLAELSGWNVVNAGVSGNTSAQALERLPGLLAEHQPKLVIVSIGGNDFLRQLPEADTRADIIAICRQALDSGAQVLLVAVPKVSMVAALGQMSDHPLYADIAAELNVPLQREGWSKVLGDSKLRSDAVHANAQGYVQFAHSLHSTAVAAGLLRQ